MRSTSRPGRRSVVTLLVLAVLVAVPLALRGRSLPDLSALPAPSHSGGETYPLTAEFEDVLNLTPGARVKLAGATIGEVTDISTHDFEARVEMEISKRYSLPRGTSAQVRFSTPLGELYIAVTPPDRPRAGTLAAHDVLSVASTSAAPSIEDTFAALSMLLNGGSLDQINLISRELGKALHGNAGPIRDLLATVDDVTGQLDAHKESFGTALTAIRRLADQLVRGDDVIDQALVVFPQAIDVLARQQTSLHRLLARIDTLSGVVTDVIGRSGDAVTADIASTRTLLASLAGVRGQLKPTLDGLVRLGAVVERSVPGNYLNADATVFLDFTSDAALPRGTRPLSGSDAVRGVMGGGTR